MSEKPEIVRYYKVIYNVTVLRGIVLPDGIFDKELRGAIKQRMVVASHMRHGTDQHSRLNLRLQRSKANITKHTTLSRYYSL